LSPGSRPRLPPWRCWRRRQAGKKLDLANLTQAQQDEMYCVYEAISKDDPYLIADSYLDPTLSDEEIKKADATLKKHVAACAAKYSWSADRRDLASDIGVHDAIIDVVAEDLVDEGVKEEQLEKILASLDKLASADVDAFYDNKWYDDAAFKTRIGAGLVATGFPNDEYLLEGALVMMESSVITAMSMARWARLP
jgi:hypothetical protein